MRGQAHESLLSPPHLRGSEASKALPPGRHNG